MKATVRPTRRDRTVNWGDRLTITGSLRKSLPWVSVEEPSAMTVYATAFIRPSAAAMSVAVIVNVEWGHGGASIEHEFPVVHRLRVPLVASMVKVSGRLADPQGRPPPSTVSADVSLFVARGTDGETLRNTRWVAQFGANGQLSARPERLMRIEGYNAGPDGFLMVFDGPLVGGAFPAISKPVRSLRPFAIRRFDSQAFRNSVAWAFSAAPETYVPNAAGSLRVDGEFLL